MASALCEDAAAGDARQAGRGPSRGPGLLAASGIGIGVAIMLGVAAAGPGRAVVRMPRPAAGPPWWFPVHLPPQVVAPLLWGAALAGLAGVAAGLTAVARGARPSPRILLAASLAITAAFAVIPPAGSTDALDYAAYGRMVALGHDPYVMTPLQLRRTGDPVAVYAPVPWQRKHSVYGPLATVEQAAAAELGGASVARITFWLKLWNALGFALVAVALDRLLRAWPGRRARAHLLWSLNPLLLWALVAGGHVDALAAAAGFLGLALLAPPGWLARAGPAGQATAAPGGQATAAPGPLAALAAGGLLGAAADIKVTYALFWLAAAWALRKAPRSLALCCGAAAGVLVPSYLWFGPPALKVLIQRDASATSDNMYQLGYRLLGDGRPPGITAVAALLFAGLAVLLLRRLPSCFAALPGARPALALTVAWLLVWPYQRPWYDAMALCLLALCPATRLDWPMLLRLFAALLFYLPGVPTGTPVAWLDQVHTAERVVLLPTARLALFIAVVLLCLRAAWVPHASAPGAPLSRADRPLPARRIPGERAG